MALQMTSAILFAAQDLLDWILTAAEDQLDWIITPERCRSIVAFLRMISTFGRAAKAQFDWIIAPEIRQGLSTWLLALRDWFLALYDLILAWLLANPFAGSLFATIALFVSVPVLFFLGYIISTFFLHLGTAFMSFAFWTTCGLTIFVPAVTIATMLAICVWFLGVVGFITVRGFFNNQRPEPVRQRSESPFLKEPQPVKAPKIPFLDEADISENKELTASFWPKSPVPEHQDVGSTSSTNQAPEPDSVLFSQSTNPNPCETPQQKGITTSIGDTTPVSKHQDVGSTSSTNQVAPDSGKSCEPTNPSSCETPKKKGLAASIWNTPPVPKNQGVAKFIWKKKPVPKHQEVGSTSSTNQAPGSEKPSESTDQAPDGEKSSESTNPFPSETPSLNPACSTEAIGGGAAASA
ncbi:hypothetical protein V8F33_002457 [Rhypophila sp. PSN 637]